MKSIETGREEAAYSRESNQEPVQLDLIRQALSSQLEHHPRTSYLLDDFEGNIGFSFELEHHKQRFLTAERMIQARLSETSPDTEVANGALTLRRLVAYNRYYARLFEACPGIYSWIKDEQQSALTEQMKQNATNAQGRLNLVDLHIRRIAPTVRQAWDKDDSPLVRVAQSDVLFSSLVANRLVNNSGEAGSDMFNQDQWSNLAWQEATVALACRILGRMHRHYLDDLRPDNWEYRSTEALKRVAGWLTPTMEAWHRQPLAHYQEVMAAVSESKAKTTNPYPNYMTNHIINSQLNELKVTRPRSWQQLHQLINREDIDTGSAVSRFMDSMQLPIATRATNDNLTRAEAIDDLDNYFQENPLKSPLNIELAISYLAQAYIETAYSQVISDGIIGKQPDKTSLVLTPGFDHRRSLKGGCYQAR